MIKTLDHPYGDLIGGRWLRGNLHTHTTASDGELPMQEVIDAYAELGYDFLMISDHDICTTAGDYAGVDARNMVLIAGNEISANGSHLLHVDANRRIEPLPQRQQVIDDANASGGFIIVNHPNWKATFDYCSIEKLQEWIDYTGMEIYNGVIGRLDGSSYAVNKWDMLLHAGRRVWGYANDDCHRLDSDLALGWNVVYAADRSSAGIVDALRHGRFYASTGVELTAITVDGLKVIVETKDARRIIAIGGVGKRLAIADDKAIEFDVAPHETSYVRFECWGDGERFAWTQPFIVSGE